MLFSRSRRFIFLHVPKTAGSSLVAALMDVAADATQAAIPMHGTASEVRAFFPDWDDYFRFTFVRNPWERLVSVYCFTMRPCQSFGDWLLRPSGHPSLQVLEFRRPQTDYIFDEGGRRAVSFVGRYERLHQDFATICNRLGVSPPLLGHLNRTPHHDYRSFYTEETRAFVAAAYAAEVAEFGYRF